MENAADQGLISAEQDVLDTAEVSISIDGALEVDDLASGIAWVWPRFGRIEAVLVSPDADSAIAGVGNTRNSLGDQLFVLEFPYDADGVVAVEHEGAWYVSPAYTLAEWARLAEGLPPSHVVSGDIGGAGFGSPEAAVAALAAAVSAQDLQGLIDVLVPYEAKLVGTYERSLGRDWLSDVEGYLDIGIGSSAVVSTEGDTSVVEVDAWYLEFADYGSSDPNYRVDADGTCLLWDDGYFYSRACGSDPRRWEVDGDWGLEAAALLYEHGWSGPRFATVRTADGGWKVSLLETARMLALPFAEEPAGVLLTGMYQDYYGDENAALVLWDLASDGPTVATGAALRLPTYGGGRFAAAIARFDSPTVVSATTPPPTAARSGRSRGTKAPTRPGLNVSIRAIAGACHWLSPPGST